MKSTKTELIKAREEFFTFLVNEKNCPELLAELIVLNSGDKPIDCWISDRMRKRRLSEIIITQFVWGDEGKYPFIYGPVWFDSEAHKFNKNLPKLVHTNNHEFWELIYTDLEKQNL